MATCLYCQEQNPPGQTHCTRCGMALPQQEEQRKQQGLSRFVWLVIFLTLFCALMIVWLGRTPPGVS